MPMVPLSPELQASPGATGQSSSWGEAQAGASGPRGAAVVCLLSTLSGYAMKTSASCSSGTWRGPQLRQERLTWTPRASAACGGGGGRKGRCTCPREHGHQAGSASLPETGTNIPALQAGLREVSQRPSQSHRAVPTPQDHTCHWEVQEGGRAPGGLQPTLWPPGSSHVCLLVCKRPGRTP